MKFLMQQKLKYFDVKALILQKIKENGGFVNCHAHLDRAYTITKENFTLANKYRHEKWSLNKSLRKNSSISQIYDRMAYATEVLLSQDVHVIGTFIDIDPDIKDKAIQASQKLRDAYKKDVIFKFICQPISGIFDKKVREWFAIGSDYVDIIGGLLKSAQGQEEQYLDIVLSTAKEKKKMAHVHVDELNIPEEIEYGLHGRVVGVHGISINAHPKEYREKVYHLMNEAKLMLVSCPMSWLDARRNESLAPVHNPIAPIDEMIERGIIIGIGIDNIADIHLPLNDADMWQDLKALIYENRLYDIDAVVKIATVNGRKTLGV